MRRLPAQPRSTRAPSTPTATLQTFHWSSQPKASPCPSTTPPCPRRSGGAHLLPAPAALSTLVLGDSRFAGAFTAMRGDDPTNRLADDPFGSVFPARLLRVGPGLVGKMTEPVGPGIQRYGSTNPWPWDQFS